MPETLRLAVHEKPGPDALVATWFAQRFLFTDEPAEVVFLPRGHSLNNEDGFAWRAEPDRVPELLGFGWGRERHSFAEKYAASATGRVWTNLLNRGKPVAHLVDLADAVHAGTLTGAFPPAADWTGLWRRVQYAYESARKKTTGDLALYLAMRTWLDQYEAGLGLGAVAAIDWTGVADRFPEQPGTYALVMRTAAPGPVLVGRTGSKKRVEVVPGYFAYVGSACNKNGGLRGRQRHHMTPARELALKWQVDFLRLRCSVVEVWFTTDSLTTTPLERECAFARSVLAMPGATVRVPGFGATDCRRCPAHLAHFESRPSFRSFRAAVERAGLRCRVRRVTVGPEGD